MASLKNASRQAWMHALINQLAFPGLGTILAGRQVGWGQAVLMVAGFVLTVGFMAQFFVVAFRYLQGAIPTDEEFRLAYRRIAWQWQSGVALCGVAWVWSLISSLSLLRAAAKVDSKNDSMDRGGPPPFPSAASPGEGKVRHDQIIE